MIDPGDIVLAYNWRRQAQGPHIARMRLTKTMYDGEYIVPMPEIDANERPAVANLLLQGVEQLGMRLSSTLPDVNFPSLKPGDDAADETARNQRRAEQGWEDMNSLTKKEGRRSRFLVAYGCGPSIIKPVGSGANHLRKIPYWHMVDPLSVYPAPTSDPDDIEPADVIIHRHVTLGWLRANYPAEAAILYKGRPARSGQHPPDLKFDLLEYNDESETVLVVVGQPREPRDLLDFTTGAAGFALLERAENRAGVCLAVVPGRITISKLMGKFDQIIGMYQAQAKLLAYELIATRKTIFPELWAVSHPNAPSSARIVRLADGKKGTIGIIENGTIIPVNVQPGQMTGQAIDRLERNARVEGGIPSDWGGESATNIRTAKRGAQVTSSSVDPTLGELQTIVAEAREAEVARAIAVMKGWYGGTTTSFYIPRNGKPVSRDYRPNDLFKTDLCIAKFSMPGVDAASIPIEIGQRTGTGEMSMDTARRMDPMVEDPEHERDQVELEGLRLALLKGLEQQAATGALDPQEVALIAQLKRGGDGLEFEECVIKAHDIIQKQQAAAQGAAGGLAAPPEQQPGLGQAPPPAPPGQAGPPPLAQLLAGLRQPTQQSGAEQAMGAAGATAPALAGASA